MKIVSKPLRYAHAEGHTDVCFTEDGQHIITCGHDGDVRIWVDIEDDDPNSHCVGESALAVCFKDKRLYVATDSNVIQAYTFPAFDKDGIVTRFTAPITQIMSSSKIEALGCSSENMEAKICSPEGGAPLFVMSEHKGPVLSIAICPHMKYAATACGDGILRIWDIDTQKIVKEINCVPKINTFYAAKVLCRIDFEPSEGKFLAYPNNREVILVDCETWGQRMAFTHGSIKCAISQCLFSPCGKYLAGSTVAGQVAVWEVESGACIDLVEHPTSHNVCAMAWNPKDSLEYNERNAQVKQALEKITDLDQKDMMKSQNQYLEELSSLTGNGVLAYCDAAGQLGTLLNCYGSDSEGAGVETVQREDNDDIVDNLIENYESDDDNVISLEKLKNETLGLVEVDDESRPASRQAPVATTVPPQPPFQPSSTPAHLEHRYLCWNSVGIVRSHAGPSEGAGALEVEFHDAGLHHAIHLTNYLGHGMAGLSTAVLALACETPSKLVCISLVGSSKEWSVSMPDTEEILCVAAAQGIVACATNARLLRLFTPMGTQRQVISVAGPVVALAAFNTTVMAVYHCAEPGVNDQHLAMDIIAMNGRQLRSKSVPLPLTPSAKLAWLGATDEGSPVAYDSAGILRLYDIASGVWLPICDTTIHSKGAADSWFIVSISEATQKVRAILCRGASFPPTAPKPIVTELPLQIPLCELDSEKAQYEEQLVRWAHTAAEVDVKAARETALKLFALACRSEIEQRALELMELLKDERLLPLAAKYASRLGRIHLAEKLTNLSDIWKKETDVLNANAHFHELDTRETYDVTSTEDLNKSLIIPQRTKERKAEVAPIKPVPIKASPGTRNPFLKAASAPRSALSPLSLTDRALINADADLEENKDLLQPQPNETFVDWFSRNKSLLEQQSPELTPSELTRHGVRTFKGLQKSENETQKRKLDDSDVETPVTNASKQSKLSAFAFKKNVEST